MLFNPLSWSLIRSEEKLLRQPCSSLHEVASPGDRLSCLTPQHHQLFQWVRFNLRRSVVTGCQSDWLFGNLLPLSGNPSSPHGLHLILSLSRGQGTRMRSVLAKRHRSQRWRRGTSVPHVSLGRTFKQRLGARAWLAFPLTVSVDHAENTPML